MDFLCKECLDYMASPVKRLHCNRFSMEVGIPLRPVVPLNPIRRCFTPCRRSTRASLNPQKGGYQGPKPKREWVADWVSKNDDVVRSLPIYIGGVSLLAVLFNRTLSGIAPVADASSSQSRADLLTLGLAVTNILNGLVWLSIKPKSISVVNPNGLQCQRVYDDLPDSVISELLWAWESLSNATCCRSLVIVYDGICILQIGYADVSDSRGGDPVAVDAGKLMRGSLYNGVVKSGSQSYLANVSLYPAKSELLFLPSNTQAVILQPLGNKGIAILGGDTIRGFSTSDQAWITLIGEKLDTTLAKVPYPSLPNETEEDFLPVVGDDGKEENELDGMGSYSPLELVCKWCTEADLILPLFGNKKDVYSLFTLSADGLSIEFGTSCTTIECESRFQQFRGRHRVMREMITNYGINYYCESGLMWGPKEAWKRDEPMSLAYKTMGDPQWAKLQIIFGEVDKETVHPDVQSASNRIMNVEPDVDSDIPILFFSNSPRLKPSKETETAGKEVGKYVVAR
ncbi:cofactor assembly of complex C [Striga asiatica]|uniref:Cofactor assembly of complex C n=1 Tax=Striga asiatica TaxID=4170 RepID=A0A5A7PHL4_STRAF|nr:cofactor assembly of complex C [Striga asiatica]